MTDIIPLVSPTLPLRIAVSSRCLFNMDKDDAVFKKKGLDVYTKNQIAKELSPLTPGPAFPLLKRLLALNKPDDILIKGMIVSGQHPFVGMRVIASAKHHGLTLEQAFFTGGSPVYPYLQPTLSDLFLTRNSIDAQHSLDAGVAAAILSPLPLDWHDDDGPIRIALDGDAVIFADECEAVAKRDGLKIFYQRQEDMMQEPINDGPFANFFRHLHHIRNKRPGCIRVCLVTARDAAARDRALRTLMHWGVQPDEAFFLGDLRKGGIIKALKPHIFFDDTARHIRDSEGHTPTGLVPYLSNGEVSKLISSS